MLKTLLVKVKTIAMIPSCVIVFHLLAGNPVKAQITPDGTIPTAVERNENIVEITGGTAAGTNLFHSFQEFSIPEGIEAYFNNSENIANIISRVTGGDVSLLEGRLSANGLANVILLNPAGFQMNGFTLNIGGDFLATTADTLVFEDGTQFGTNPENPVNLTVNVPLGIQWNGQSAAPILINNSTLQLPDGRLMTIVGGEVVVTNSRLAAPGGRVEIGGIATAGLVEIGEAGALIFPEEGARADVSLTNSSLDVSAEQGGNIGVYSNNLNLEKSTIQSGIAENLGNPEAVAGDVTLNALGKIELNQSFIINNVGEGAVGNAGNIAIEAASLAVVNGGQILASTWGQGNAGKIVINVDDDLVLDDGRSDLFTGISARVNQAGKGNGGSVEINTNSLEIVNGARILTDAAGIGKAGNIAINAQETIRIDGTGGESEISSSGVGAVSEAGDVEIGTGSLAVLNGGAISVSTFGQGNGGNIIVNAEGLVEVAGGASGIFNVLANKAIGNAGNIEINAQNLAVVDGGQILASTSGEGNAGNILINANDGVILDNANSDLLTISASVSKKATGNAGDININTNSLEVMNGARIVTDTAGKGDSGIITIQAENVKFTGDFSGASSDVQAGGVGAAQGVVINTNSLEISKGAVISASTFGMGNAGSIIINANNNVLVNGEGSEGFTGIASAVEIPGVGDGGGVRIKATNLEILNGGIISASTLGEGNAGEIIINGTGKIFLESSRIENSVARSGAGAAGNITINGENLALNNNSVIRSGTGGKGDGGDVKINTAETVAINNSNITTTVSSTAIGNAGDIEITTANAEIFNGGQVNASTRGIGDAGDITINAAQRFVIRDNSFINSTIAREGKGNGGIIEINTASLELLNRGEIFNRSIGLGDGGGIIINATNNGNGKVVIDGADENGVPSIISTAAGTSKATSNAAGNAGPIRITTDSFEVLNGGIISTLTNKEGNAGNIQIEASQGVVFEGERVQSEGRIFSSAATSSVENEGRGNAGNIEINAPRVTLFKGGILSAKTQGEGDGGNIIINAPNEVVIDGTTSDGIPSQIAAEVAREAIGNAGNIEITTSTLKVVNGSQINANTLGRGNAGKISINATENVVFAGGRELTNSEGETIFQGSAATSSVGVTGKGDAGDIEINAFRLELLRGGILATRTFGAGNGGKIILNATENVVIDGARNGAGALTQVVSEARINSQGKSGNIELNAANLEVVNGARINANAAGIGDGGNIKITATENLAFDNANITSALTTKEAVGDAGAVTIDGANIRIINNSQILTSTEGQGAAGAVEIIATETVDLSESNIESAVAAGAIGAAGNITIQAANLAAENAKISSSAIGAGAAGSVNLAANSGLKIGNTQVESQAGIGAGNAGSVTVNAPTVTVSN
ncbi:MAG: filamentous hemagglutinin N-terminal domain-containing protein, partial [Gomphosphaeria aponina SAG 52.96 = DSM 107014]|nr:filamentous hemagglutinin N-terminal domain-containing protein [Gomphosphaeria aponina SAG 52.96 = DSM 107014]